MARLIRGALALAALTILPSTVIAQQPATTGLVETIVDNQTADRLHEQAVALQADVDTWTKAAKLYAKSAQLRPYGDLRAYADYERAGQLLFAKNRVEMARRMYVKAAERALEAGRVYEAALAYASAAQFVAHYGARPVDEDVGLKHFEMALRLSESPLLTEEQRIKIKSRVRA